MALTEEQERVLWRERGQEEGGESRITLIERYTPLATRIAGRLYASRFDDEVEYNDYLQFAFVGLVEAIDRFDVNVGASFSTFAGYRIKGAIFNGIEKWTERRQQLANKRRIEHERLASLGAQTKKGDAGELFATIADTAIGLALGFLLEDADLSLKEHAQTRDQAYTSSVLSDLRTQLQTLVSELPAREKWIIQYHYYHQMNFEKLGHILGLSKGRISQLHKRALQELRQRFEERDDFDGYF